MNVAFSTQQNVNSTNTNNYANDKPSKNEQKCNNKNKINTNTNTSLAGKSKASRLVANLMKQKENLADSKNSLIERTLKNGDSQSSIKDLVKDIDKQIEAIDGEISKLQMDDVRKSLGTDDKTKKGENTKKPSNSTSGDEANADPSVDKMN